MSLAESREQDPKPRGVATVSKGEANQQISPIENFPYPFNVYSRRLAIPAKDTKQSKWACCHRPFMKMCCLEPVALADRWKRRANDTLLAVDLPGWSVFVRGSPAGLVSTGQGKSVDQAR